MIDKIRYWFEQKAFGVCEWWGKKLGIRLIFACILFICHFLLSGLLLSFTSLWLLFLSIKKVLSLIPTAAAAAFGICKLNLLRFFIKVAKHVEVTIFFINLALLCLTFSNPIIGFMHLY